MTNRSILQLWFGAALAMVIVTMACIRWIDYPVAAAHLRNFHSGSTTGTVFSGMNIVETQLVVIAVLGSAKLWKGSLPKWANTLMVACVASVLAYALNDAILKIIFGRANPEAFFHHHAAKFNLLHGDEYCSFPSGHMMLAAAFAAVAVHVYPRTWIPTALLLLLGCVVLVVGEWHYVSDVIAGTFVGFTAGLAIVHVLPKDASSKALARGA